ncbi:MAG: hypothetical protein V1779_08585 [bacterium]
MYSVHQAIYENGKLVLSGNEQIPNGAKVFVAVVSEPQQDYLLKASEEVLDKIWNNEEDNIYEELLKK